MSLLEAIWTTMSQLAPWLILGTMIAGLLHVLIPRNFMQRSLRGRWGVVRAVMLGVPLPLCSCGVIPTGVGLKKSGASHGASVGFLISTPQTGVDSILVSASFLGWPFAIFKVFAAAITGLVGGWLTDSIVAEDVKDQDSALEQDPTRRTWHAFWEHVDEVLRSIWIWLIVGVLISAIISEFVPESAFKTVNAWGLIPALLLVLLISTPIYVCATASVPIAAALVAGGLPPSVALVFLMAGPATNVATMSAIGANFGWKTTLIYLATIIVGSICFAWLFDWVLTTGNLAGHAGHHHDTVSWWEQVSAGILLVIFGWFAIDAIRGWTRRKATLSLPSDQDRSEFRVEGMNCQSCVAKVEKSIGKVPGVHHVSVDLEPGRAVVLGDADGKSIEQAIQDAGMRVGAE